MGRLSWLNWGKGADDLAALTKNLDNATKSLNQLGDLSKVDDLGDAGKYLNKLDDGKVYPKPGYKIETPGSGTITASQKTGVVWEPGMRLVPTASKAQKLTDAQKAINATNQLNKAKTIWQPNALRNLKLTGMLSGMAVIGYGAFQVISVIGTFSDALETRINNFFGVDAKNTCLDKGLVEGTQEYLDCIEDVEEEGAKNMLYTGIAVVGIAIVGVISLTGKKDSKGEKVEIEIKQPSEASATGA